MKAEFSDAYRMRNSVLVVMLAAALMTAAGVLYGVVGLMRWASYAWMNSYSTGTATMP